MIDLSYWEACYLENPLDVAIVGAGIVGLNAALKIKELDPDIRMAIFERHPIPRGASIRNAGFACLGSLTELIENVDTHGWEVVSELLSKRWEGLQELRGLLTDEALEYTANPGYEIFLSGEEEIYQRCLSALPTFNQVFSEVTGVGQAFQVADEEIATLGLVGVKHLIRQNVEGQLHADKMMKALVEKVQAAGIPIYFGWDIQGWSQQGQEELRLTSTTGLDRNTRKLLLATNGYTKRLGPSLPLQPVRNQVVLTEPISDLALKGSFHYHKGYVYFRNLGNRILLGGARHLDLEASQTDQHGQNQHINSYLKDFLIRHLTQGKEVKITHQWSGILGVGEALRPIMKWIAPNVLTAVRLGGMGVAIGTLVGQEAGEKILRKTLLTLPNQ
ncbi:MAG: FAD-dependent oxidoreductase [Bacteroidota bacterium]